MSRLFDSLNGAKLLAADENGKYIYKMAEIRDITKTMSFENEIEEGMSFGFYDSEPLSITFEMDPKEWAIIRNAFRTRKRQRLKRKRK